VRNIIDKIYDSKERRVGMWGSACMRASRDRSRPSITVTPARQSARPWMALKIGPVIRANSIALLVIWACPGRVPSRSEQRYSCEIPRTHWSAGELLL